ncbi:aldose epimerase family protein [Oricola sp.]|uniref:aldose epimerase family protein n=1 Tax=Oricola sp. TaxID=1979950 RepID=UPI003BACA975
MAIFGQLKTGEAVERYEIGGGGLTASVITYGAAIRDLRLAGHEAPLVLGFETLDDYVRHSPFFGATVGRFANRIGGGHIVVDGHDYQLDRNDGANTLHGGKGGFSQRVWQVERVSDSHIEMVLESQDGDMGFPGRLVARCRYELGEDGSLEVTLTAECDAPTVCSLAHHSYFNLCDGGAGPVTAHEVRIDADTYLPVDSGLLPTGAPRPVADTRFDFRQMRRINSHDTRADYDLNYCTGTARMPIREVARVSARETGTEMTVETTEPGLQFFTAAALDVPVPGLGGRRYGHHAGFCLETQLWPDAPNQPSFPNALLRPGGKSVQRTIYRFAKGRG